MEPGFARIPRAWNGWAGIGSRPLTSGPPGRKTAGQELPGRRGSGAGHGSESGVLNKVG
jgi:hypothetical protein